jgi:hypothetical protein
MNESENLLNRPKTGQMLKHLLPVKNMNYFYEKFAELLLHECSRIADDWVNNEDNGKNYPSDKIKQHFGGLVR